MNKTLDKMRTAFKEINLSFSGTGNVEGKELTLDFESRSIELDQTDRNRPKIIIELKANEKDGTFWTMTQHLA